jgi:hypothetical protein
VKVPIACSLTETAARSQIDEWHDLIATSVAALDRVSPTDLRLRLGTGVEGAGAVLRLAQREKACCPFFDFALLVEADSLVLRVTVPADAAPILDDFSRGVSEVS